MKTLWIKEAMMLLPVLFQQRFGNRLSLAVASGDVRDAWVYARR